MRGKGGGGGGEFKFTIQQMTNSNKKRCSFRTLLEANWYDFIKVWRLKDSRLSLRILYNQGFICFILMH